MPTFHADDAPDAQGLDKDVANKTTPPPSGIWENIKNRRFSQTSPIDTDIKNAVTGAVDTLKTAATALGLPTQLAPDPNHRQKQEEAIGKIGTAAKEIVKAPLRSLAGKPQPGQPQESAPVGLIERPIAALDTFMGGDPGEARLRNQKGDTLGAVSALVTGPLLMHGLSKVTEGTKPPPTIGPKPVSALPKLRDNIPANTSSTTERIMRVLQPGRYLPNEYDRTNKLASVFGPDGKVEVAKDVKSLLPELDKTAREMGVHPKGIAGTEGVTRRPGEGIKESETVSKLLETTMSRLEGDYKSILDPNRTTIVPTQSVADEISNYKTPAMVNFAAQNPGSDIAKAVDYLDKAESMFRNKQLSLGEIDDLRKYYYNVTKTGEAGRTALRSNEVFQADKAIEDGLRQLTYDRLETIARQQGKPAGFIRNLKDAQRKIYGLSDLANPNATQLMNQDAITRGYSMLQKANVTSAFHPESMTPVVSIHGLVKGFAGDPKSLKSGEQRVRESFAEKGVPVDKRERVAVGAVKTVKSVAKNGALGRVPNREDDNKRPAPPTTVKMRAPDGSTKDVPVSEMEHWKQKGAQVVQ